MLSLAVGLLWTVKIIWKLQILKNSETWSCTSFAKSGVLIAIFYCFLLLLDLICFRHIFWLPACKRLEYQLDSWRWPHTIPIISVFGIFNWVVWFCFFPSRTHLILHEASFALCHGKRKASEIQLALEDSRPYLGAGMFQSGRHLGSTQKGISSCGAGAGSVTWIHSGAPTQLEHWTFGTGGKCWSVSHLLSSLCGTTGHWWDHPRSAVWWLAWTFCSFTGGCHRFLDSRADLRCAKRTGRASSWFSGQSSWWCSCSNCQWCRSEFDGETPTCPSRAMAEVIPMPCFGFGRWGTCPVSCGFSLAGVLGFLTFHARWGSSFLFAKSFSPAPLLHSRENSTKAYRNRMG